MIRTALVAVAMLATAGCALRPAAGEPPAWPVDLPAAVELTATPFHPQDRYQCGPVALATALQAIAQAEQQLGDADSNPAGAGSASAVRVAVAATRAALLARPAAAEPACCDTPP